MTGSGLFLDSMWGPRRETGAQPIIAPVISGNYSTAQQSGRAFLDSSGLNYVMGYG